jgi:hypothetical protein
VFILVRGLLTIEPRRIRTSYGSETARTSGRPWLRAAFNASTRNVESSRLDSCQAST